MGKFQKLQPSGGRPVGGASSALSTSSANARPARPAGPAACGDDDPVRRRNAALLASGGDVVTTRKTFMPGVLTTVPLQVRRAFAPLLGSSQANDRLRLIKKLGAGGFQPQGMIKSKFLSGDTSFKGAAFVLLTGKVESDGSDVGSGSEDEEAIPKGEQFLEHEPLVLDKDGEDGEISVPPLLAQFLRPHQREGVRFVYECVSGLRNGGGCLGSILADDMGLGKTLQSIAVIYTLLKVAGLKRVVVACPCSLVRNWEMEFDKWVNSRIDALPPAERGRRIDCVAIADMDTKGVASTVDAFLRRGGARLADVLVISYETFRLHAKRFAASTAEPVDVLVCDEAHRLKNGDALTTTALAALPCRRRILLTGTPMQNDLGEFFALADFACPGLYGSRDRFSKDFENPILKAREPDASKATTAKAAACQSDLSAKADSFILRRENRLNAVHLPPKLTLVLCCNLTPVQKLMYQYYVDKKNREHAQTGKVTDPLGYLQKLQKVCAHPGIAARDDERLRRFLPAEPQSDKRGRSADGPLDVALSGKMRLLFDLMTELKNGPRKERIVIVSAKTRARVWETRARVWETANRILVGPQRPATSRPVFTSTLDAIEALCKQRSWHSCKLSGATSSKKRKQFNDEFNEPASGYFAFLLSSRAGGCGLNLIGGSRLVMFDLDWNPATDKQAAARCWRDGQKYRCYTYRFVSTGTLEERMLQRQLSKEGLLSVIEDKKQVNTFSSKDLKRLFRYRRDTKSDTHDQLKCAACAGAEQRLNYNDDSGAVNVLDADAAERCAQLVLRIVPEAPLQGGPDFQGAAPPAAADAAAPLDAAAVDAAAVVEIDAAAFEAPPFGAFDAPTSAFALGAVSALRRGDLTTIPSVIKALRSCVKLLDNSDSARAFVSRVDEAWDTTFVAQLAQPAFNDDGAFEFDATAFSKAQLYPLPKEEDLNNWGHHSSVSTVDDRELRKADSRARVVSFAFTMEITADLIKLDNDLEAQRKLECEAPGGGEAQNDGEAPDDIASKACSKPHGDGASKAAPSDDDDDAPARAAPREASDEDDDDDALARAPPVRRARAPRAPPASSKPADSKPRRRPRIDEDEDSLARLPPPRAARPRGESPREIADFDGENFDGGNIDVAHFDGGPADAPLPPLYPPLRFTPPDDDFVPAPARREASPSPKRRRGEAPAENDIQACPICTFHNAKHAKACAMCQTQLRKRGR